MEIFNTKLNHKEELQRIRNSLELLKEWSSIDYLYSEVYHVARDADFYC
jgi:hypothetical protein